MIRLIAGTVFFVAVSFVSMGVRAPDPYQAFSALRVQKIEAPNFSLPQVDGKAIELSDYRRKIVLLGFFKTF